MSEHRSVWSRPLTRLGVVALLGLFVSAPTPGNVGGCGGNLASQRVESEQQFFEDGLCSHFCLRLMECGVLCTALANPPAGCDNNNPSAEAFAMCVRGEINSDYFGVSRCPRSCGMVGTFQGAYQWDVQACGDAVLSRTCNERGPGSIGNLFREVPEECAHVCRPVQ